MSIRAIDWSLRLVQRIHPNLSPTARHVLTVIADAVNDETRECWVRVSTIQDRTNLSRRSVQRALTQLEAAGIITRQIQGAPDARVPAHYRANLYTWQADPARLKVVDNPSGE